jgi:cystathionine beta-synthase
MPRGKYVGSISDNHLFACLLDKNFVKDQAVSSIMQQPFPVVNANASIEEVSKLINKDNPAVIMNDMGGNTHIITKYDIIEAIAG